jgi:putative ABC transport system permease protein
VSAVRRAVRAGAARHRLAGTVVALVVLASTAMLVLGIGLLTGADEPFERSFAAQNGAHATVYFDPRLTAGQLRDTATRPGVAAAGGPYRTASLALAYVDRPSIHLPPAVVAGRDTPDGPVDRLHLDSGRWANGPGEIVLARELGGRGFPLGQRLSTGSVTLTVVGVASSITRTADAWVMADQMATLAGAGSPAMQMLYRFDSAADEAAVAAGVASAATGLPAGAILGTGSYLAVKLANDEGAAAATPFVVAFAVLGMVVSVLIVANVVGGAVVAGYRHIGVLKAIGFTPAQVVTVYAGRLLLPAVVGGALGLLAGNLLAVPVLSQAAEAYHSSVVTVPVWANAFAVTALALVVGAAAIAPALRAGRMSATAALTVGRAPAAGRGRRVRRLLAKLPLPRPIALGLGSPFVRPARAAGAFVAVTLGAATLVLAAGLWTSLSRVAEGVERVAAVPVRVELGPGPGGGPGPEGGGPGPHGGGAPEPAAPADPAVVEAVLRDVPGAARVAAVRSAAATVTGLTGSVPVIGYSGESSWTGYRLVTGRWFAGPDEAIVPTNVLTATGKRIGDTLTLTAGGTQRPVRIVGELFQPGEDPHVMTVDTVVSALDPDAGVHRFEVGLTPGTDATDYVSTVNQRLPRGSGVAFVESGENDTITLFLGLIVMLVLLVIGVAAIGVFNTALLNTREQVRDIGILKTVGMTPRQVRLMVLTSLAGLGAVAGAVAVPAGMLLHREVLYAMARAAATGLPPEFVAVFGPLGLVTLAAAGLAIAVAGALVPAGWAARSRPSVALRAE